VLAQLQAKSPGEVTYWGTASGAPLPAPIQEVIRWTARQVRAEHEAVLASWPRTIQFSMHGLGEVLFCHATPQSETDCFTRLTAESLLLPLFEGLGVSVVVCGHTHMQFDRMIGRTRVVNAGSVGMPFGRPGADWALIGPDVRLQHTSFDLSHAADRLRACPYPQAEELAAQILRPPSESAMLDVFTNASFQRP